MRGQSSNNCHGLSIARRRHATKEEEARTISEDAGLDTATDNACFVTPMAAQVVKRLPEGDDWSYELKFDVDGRGVG